MTDPATTHKSHDWSAEGYCYDCTCSIASRTARLICEPSTDDSGYVDELRLKMEPVDDNKERNPQWLP